MPKTIETYQGLQTYLTSITKKVMDALSKEIGQILWNNVDVMWYQRAGYTNDPKTNHRTQEILNSITNSVAEVTGNRVNIKIYFDEDKIQPHEAEEFSPMPFFNEHMSLDGTTVYDGRTLGSWVIEWMEEGQGMHSGSRSLAPYEGVHFFQKTEKKVGNADTGKISAYIRDFVIGEYRKNGIRIIR